MKKRLMALLLTAVTLLSLLTGCASKDGPDEKPVELEPAGNVVSAYTKDDTDYSSKPEEKTRIVRLHYRRNDDTANNREVYGAWNVWAWDMANGGNGAAYPFTGYDDYGVYADLDLDVISEGKGTSRIGFIIRTDNWTKDPDGDRDIVIADSVPGGLQEVFVRTGESTVFETRDNALKSIISYAMLRDARTVSVYFKPLSAGFVPYSGRFSVTVNGEKAGFSMGEFDTDLKSVPLTLKKDIDIKDVVKISYRFDKSWINEVDLMLTGYYDTEEFISRYTYTGTDLGVTFPDQKSPVTVFKLWAPTSTAVKLNIYNSGNYDTDKEPRAVYEMKAGEKGVFSYTVDDDLNGLYYTYTVTNSKGTNEVVDPYAKSAGLNGRRGMIVDFGRLNATIEGWSEDVRPFSGNSVDASIYELHVRDMTISPTSGVSEENRGRFLGLAETGTTYTEGGVTVSTGLDHLKELGITHVQIQPFYDYSSVDESRSTGLMSADTYNWGYDPLNYNVLEGSYSTDPRNGLQRIIEFKQMVMAMHKAGISINMDVVYNHTSASENSNLNLIVPYYYYRTRANGTFFNGSGCGNEIASDRFMVNKFIRESCLFWAEEYHLSGFRFDLMGLLDNRTMIDVYNDCSAVYPDIMIYGEPWAGGTSKLKSGTDENNLSGQMTVQDSLGQSYFAGNGVLVGAFNDIIRNAVRGDNGPGKGFVQGMGSDASVIALGIEGVFSKQTVASSGIDPNQVINYVSCHDNYTLYDQLVQTAGDRDLKAAYTQADSIVFLAEGVPFMQEGEEFMRSKWDDTLGRYEGNSYISGDFVNAMDWSLKVKNMDVFRKTAELIRFRSENPSFRLASRNEINERLHIVKAASGYIEYDVDGFKVISALNSTTAELEGSWSIVYSNLRSGYGTVSDRFGVMANETVVLKKNG